MEHLESAGWEANWAWSLPLIVVSVVIHVLGLGLVNERVVHALKTVRDRPYFLPRFVVAKPTPTPSPSTKTRQNTNNGVSDRRRRKPRRPQR